MDLTPYVDRLRADLDAVAEAAGPDAVAGAARLVSALDPAVRMALLEALADAAAEVTTALPGAAVDVRMKGREPQLVVTATERPGPPDNDGAARDHADRDSADEAAGADDGAVARITVRIPESLKARAEELAATGGQSLNGWIVQALRVATRERAIDVDIDVSAFPFPGGAGFASRRPRRMQGWVR